MKRHVRIVCMAGLMILAILLTACSQSDNGGGNTNGPENESANNGENASGNSESVNITFMGWEASPLETEAVKRGLEMFMEQNPDIKVEYTPVPGEQYHTRLLTMLAGNAAPDVFFLGADQYRAYTEKGVLLDLTSYFQEKYELTDFIESSATIMNIDGSVYGVSSCTVSPVLYYNKDLFDQAGLPYPPSDPAEAWTWDEFLDVARQLKSVSEYGVYGLENLQMTIAQMLTNNGKLFNDDYTQSAINSPEVREVLQAILDMRVKENLSPEAVVLENIGMRATQMLQSGQVAMLIDGSWALQELAQMDFEVGVGVLPKFSTAATVGQAHVHSAWADTPHPEAAWKLIDFLSSEEYQIQLIKEGLWMPNRAALYEEENIDRWYNEEVHPEGFRELIPYFLNAEVYPLTQIYTSEIITVTEDELQGFWYDNRSLDDVLGTIETKTNELLSESR